MHATYINNIYNLPCMRALFWAPCDSGRDQLSEEEKDAFFADPMKIVGKHFVANSDRLDETPYKVAGVNIFKDELLYQITFVDCVDSMKYNCEDMMVMVKDSVILVWLF